MCGNRLGMQNVYLLQYSVLLREETMNKNKSNLWVLLGLITILLFTGLLLFILLFPSKNTPSIAEAHKQSVPPAKEQPFDKPVYIPTQKSFIPLSDEDMRAKIKKIFEPLLSEAESEELSRSYTAKDYHIRIMPDLYDDLHAQSLSAEEQDKYKKIQAAHQQVLEILRQNSTLEDKQSDESVSTPEEKEEFYLPGLTAIKGLKGQPQTSMKEIPCPDRYTSYRSWDKICQEIQFADGTKSIVYVVASRGVAAREDFDAQEHLLVRNSFWTTGGYFDPDQIRHIPDYPSALSEAIFYNQDGTVNKTETYLPSTAEATNKTYCDLYKSECIAL